MRWLLACMLGQLAWLGTAAAQEAPEDDSSLQLFQLDELLHDQTSVASHEQKSVRESPGVITLITREEILATGARDLMDVLALVPGFWFGTDVQGVTDTGFRGAWAHEGKMLLMVDGVPMNEFAYLTNQLGHHYPVEQLERIEIIRGPGSALYGGFAELCVVNLITRSAKDLHGSAVSLYYGQMGRSFGQADLHLATGQEDVGGVSGVDFTGAVSVGRGIRSTATYKDFSGNSYPMASASDLNPTFVDLGLQVKKLRLRLLYDNYALTERDSLTTVQPQVIDERFTQAVVDGSYDFEAGPLTVTPRLTYHFQQPWSVPQATLPDYLDLSISHLTAKLSAVYHVRPNLSLLLGSEDYVETSHFNRPEAAPPGFLFGPNHDQTSITYWNFAGFIEMQLDTFLGNVTAGARAEHHSGVGNAFAPRLVVTKVLGDFNVKALASSAFRAPGAENINFSLPGSSPHHERTQDYELELGYRLSEHFFVSANAFDITVRDVLVYSAQTTGQYYAAFPRTGTDGAEAQARVLYPWGFVNASYSFYTAWSPFLDAVKNQVPLFAVPGSNSLLAGFPAHKLALNGKVRLGRNLSVSPALIYLSPREGQVQGDGAGNGVFGTEPALFLANVFFTYENLLTKNLEATVGVYNLLDQGYSFLQPYSSGHAPLPGPAREFIGRVAYAF